MGGPGPLRPATLALPAPEERLALPPPSPDPGPALPEPPSAPAAPERAPRKAPATREVPAPLTWARVRSKGNTQPLPPAVLAALDLPRNDAVRPKIGFLGRVAAWLGAWVGIAPKTTNRAVLAAQLGASGLAGRLPPGAPLAGPVGVPDLEPALDQAVRQLREALSKVSSNAEGLFTALKTRSARELAEIDRAFGLGHGGRWLSLRDGLSSVLRGEERRSALGLLEDAQATLRRPEGPPLHDLGADPSGFFGPSGDGRLPQTIDKVLELRKRPPLSKADLVNRHEMTGNNAVTLHPGGHRAFWSMLRAIESAESFVHISFFIYKDDEHGRRLTDLLIAKAKAGVKVRVTLDESGDLLAMSASARAIMKELEAAGVEVACNHVIDGGRPTALLNSPDHRKIVLVDGKVAFTGGMNIGTDYITEWRDHFMELHGDAVHQLQVEWMTNWIGLGMPFEPEVGDDEVRARYFPSVPSEGTTRVKIAQSIPGESREIGRSFLDMIDRAASSIWIESPYISSPEIQEALLRARDRGVKVNVIIPGENNHPACEHAARPTLRELVRRGGNVYAYDGMHHGKVMVIDAKWTIFGTANLDTLSLEKVYEVNLHLDGREVAQRVLAEIFLEDLGRSKKLTVDDLGEAPLRERLWTKLSDFI